MGASPPLRRLSSSLCILGGFGSGLGGGHGWVSAQNGVSHDLSNPGSNNPGSRNSRVRQPAGVNLLARMAPKVVQNRPILFGSESNVIQNTSFGRGAWAPRPKDVFYMIFDIVCK